MNTLVVTIIAFILGAALGWTANQQCWSARRTTAWIWHFLARVHARLYWYAAFTILRPWRERMIRRKLQSYWDAYIEEEERTFPWFDNEEMLADATNQLRVRSAANITAHVDRAMKRIPKDQPDPSVFYVVGQRSQICSGNPTPDEYQRYFENCEPESASLPPFKEKK